MPVKFTERLAWLCRAIIYDITRQTKLSAAFVSTHTTRARRNRNDMKNVATRAFEYLDQQLTYLPGVGRGLDGMKEEKKRLLKF